MNLKTCPTCHAKYPVEFEVCPQDGNQLESGNGAAQAEAEWAAGKVVGGKYRISSGLGEDEIAAIYQAHTLSLNAPRIIRVLQPRLASDTAACEEFGKAADLLQKVPQTNVIAVEGRGNAEDGRPFLVTEFFGGQTLAELTHAEGPIEPLRACAIIRQVASALEAAHRIGLLHLSLTPSSILVSGAPGEETVKVQGFGAAQVRMRWTRNGSLPSGQTLRDRLPADTRYASPELALGTPPDLLDERADLYALGAIFYEMLSGRLPFASPGADGPENSEWAMTTMAAHLEDAAAPMGAGHGGMEVPAPLAAVVMALLEKRPELRLPSARDVIEKLALVEIRTASLAKPALLPQVVKGKPVSAARIPAVPTPVSAPTEPIEIEESKPATAPEPLIAPLPTSEAAIDALDLKVGFERPSPPHLAKVPAAELPATARIPTSRRDNSTLFGAEQPPSPPQFGRWALAALAALVLAAGAWFFVTRARTQWLGAGPLSPIKADELRGVEGANPSSSEHPAQATSQPTIQSQSATTPAGQPAQPSQPPIVQPPAGAPNQSQPVSQEGTASAPTGAQAGRAEPAGGSSKPSIVSKPSGTAAAAPQSAPPAASSEDIAAQVKRAIAAGDVFFELGEYDYAIRAYQGPLKYDPKNLELKLKIERAQKAKAAEEQYLGQ